MKSTTSSFSIDFIVLVISLMVTLVVWYFTKMSLGTATGAIVLFLGLLLSFLMFGLTYSLAFSQRRAEKMAESLTAKYKDSEEKFLLFMNNNPALTWIKNSKTWKYVYTNKAFAQALNKVDFSEKTDYDIWPKETADILRKIDEDTLKNQDYPTTTVPVTIKKAGQRLWQISCFLITLSSGDKFIGGAAIDVTEMKNNEDTLTRMNDLMVGRELKMLELKMEISTLKSKSND